jgi:hypothetical protein
LRVKWVMVRVGRGWRRRGIMLDSGSKGGGWHV